VRDLTPGLVDARTRDQLQHTLDVIVIIPIVICVVTSSACWSPRTAA
jgi:hypothetical protein